MAASVTPPRRTIRDVVIQSVLAYQTQRHQRQRDKRENLPRTGAVEDDGDVGFWEEEEGTMELPQIGADNAKNVLILMSDTGGGHRASAEAIRHAFRIEFGDEYRVFVKDLFMEHAGWPLNDMEKTYKFMVKHVQLWKVAFHSTSPRWVHNLYLAAVAAFYTKKVEAGLKKYKPDIIISVHPLMQHIPLCVLKWQNLQKRVVFVTVITDLNTCHRTWFHTGVNRCYCPSDEVAKRASLDDLEPCQIRVFGLPIRPSFCRAVLVKDELRKEFEMDPDLPAVLLMGGGEGMGPVKTTAQALGESLFDKELGRPIGQLVVICGRNQTLRSTLQGIQWNIPAKINGFVTQMEKWMEACDCIITKAGPGTIAEALIRGLPIILNDFIPGQEVGNIPYVVDNGAGVFSKSSKQTASLVARWFSSGSEELKTMSQNALKLAQPNAVFNIVKDIHKLAQQQGPLSQISDSLASSVAEARSTRFGPSPNTRPRGLGADPKIEHRSSTSTRSSDASSQAPLSPRNSDAERLWRRGSARETDASKLRMASSSRALEADLDDGKTGREEAGWRKIRAEDSGGVCSTP